MILSKGEKKNHVLCEYFLINLKVRQSNLPKISAKITVSAAGAQKD